MTEEDLIELEQETNCFAGLCDGVRSGESLITVTDLLEYMKHRRITNGMHLLIAEVRRLKAENETLRTVELKLVMEQDDPDAAVHVLNDAMNRRQVKVCCTGIEELPRETKA